MFMSSGPQRVGNATSAQRGTGEVSFQELFDKQKAYFATDVTKTYEWRIDRLDRFSCMLKENDRRFSQASRRKLQNFCSCPFIFMFLTKSVGAEKAVMKAAAEHFTPVFLELGGQKSSDC
jgi:hypothetical protein